MQYFTQRCSTHKQPWRSIPISLWYALWHFQSSELTEAVAYPGISKKGAWQSARENLHDHAHFYYMRMRIIAWCTLNYQYIVGNTNTVAQQLASCHESLFV